eukprot:TRINITY_DN11874_c0_g1_i1.p1 TRINITY_DN11874_c0_g1~~TRINITY_DN11874_c0_g1_i1.p1  ORF type:complete len:721 (-),score=113.93 TRINITY_DN11874_c0_g1_i1:251-2413(-)
MSGISHSNESARNVSLPTQSVHNHDTENQAAYDNQSLHPATLTRQPSSNTPPQNLFGYSSQPLSSPISNMESASTLHNHSSHPNNIQPSFSDNNNTNNPIYTPPHSALTGSPRPQRRTLSSQDLSITIPQTQSMNQTFNNSNNIIHSSNGSVNNSNNANSEVNVNVMMIPRVGQAGNVEELTLAPLPPTDLSSYESPRAIPIAPYLGLLKVWRRSCMLVIAYFLPATVLLILGVSIDARRICDAPLRIWALLQMLIQVSIVILSFYILKVIPKPTDPIPDQEQKMRSAFFFYACNRLLDCVWFGWFVLGAGWIFGSSTCHTTSPSLYYVSFTLIITQFLVLFIVIFFMFFSCLCIFARLRTVGNYSPRPIRYHVHPEGAPRHLVARLPTTIYRTSDNTIPFEHAVCGICLGDYEIGESLRHLPCNHHFHTSCVDRWLAVRKLCPFCKHPIDAKFNPTAEPTTQTFVRLSSLPPSQRSARGANQPRSDDIFNVMEPRTSEHTVVRAATISSLENSPALFSTRILSSSTLPQSSSSTHLLQTSNESISDHFSNHEPQIPIIGAVPINTSNINHLNNMSSMNNLNDRAPQRSLSEFSLNSINLMSASPSLMNLDNIASRDTLSTIIIRNTEEGDNEDVEQALSPHLAHITSTPLSRVSSNAVRISSVDINYENQPNYIRNTLSSHGNLMFSAQAPNTQGPRKQSHFENIDENDSEDANDTPQT